MIEGDGILLKYKGSASDVTIPEGVISICDEAFYFSNGSNVQNISIPNSVEHVGAFAFANTPWYGNYAGDFNIVGKSCADRL